MRVLASTGPAKTDIPIEPTDAMIGRHKPLQKIGAGGGFDAIFAEQIEPDVRRFGDYELLQEIARGGMGVVYRARQVSLNRIVAVKMLLFGNFASDEFVKRFHTEAKAAASLQHPNIVAIHEIGEHKGQHYFSMELVEGQSLADVVRDRPLSPKRAAVYVQSVAEAIHYAHEHGVLHRDLKPSNILIDANDQPRVADFGLAKVLQSGAATTASGQVLGTPNYMPPEQASPRPGNKTPASDVYSLGAILFHLITGRPPFLAETVEATLFQVLNTDPVAPRLLNLTIPRDLETICLRCLEKDPRRRYHSARALAEDLRHFLSDEPILARPTSSPEKFWRWCHRKPAHAALIGVLVMVTVGAVLAAIYFNRLRNKADALADAERLRGYVNSVSLASQELRSGNRAQAEELLKEGIPRPGEPDHRDFTWRYLWRQTHSQHVLGLPAHNQVVGEMRFSADDKLLATYAWDRTLRVWKWRTRETVFELPGAAGLGGFLPDGNTYIVGDMSGSIYHYNLTTGERTCVLTNAGELVTCAANGKTIAIRAENSLLSVYDTETLQTTFFPPQPVDRFLDNGEGSPARLSPNGRLLAIVQPLAINKRKDQDIQVWDVTSGIELEPLREEDQIHSVEFSPDGNCLAVGNGNGTVKLWNLETREALTIKVSSLPIQALAFRPGGTRLVTGGRSQAVKWLDASSGKLLNEQLPGQFGMAAALAFSSNGKSLAASGRDSPVWIWNTEEPEPPATSHDLHSHEWGNVAISPDSKFIAAGCTGNLVRVWRVEDFSVKAELPGALYVVAFYQDSNVLLTANKSNSPQWWNIETGEAIAIPRYKGNIDEVIDVALSPDRRRAALGAADGTLQLLDIGTGREIARWQGHTNSVRSVAFLPDGKLLVSGGSDRSVKIWDVETQRLLGNKEEHKGAVCSVACSPTGGFVASGCGAGTIKLWKADQINKGAIARSSYHADSIHTLAFSPDSLTLASGSEDGMLKLWSIAQLKRMTTMPEHAGQLPEIASIPQDGPLRVVVFSRDGNTLATVTDQGSLRLYRAATQSEIPAVVH